MYKTPIQELTTKLDKLALELSSTREELTSTKKEVKTLQGLLIETWLSNTESKGQSKIPNDAEAAAGKPQTSTKHSTITTNKSPKHNPYEKKINTIPTNKLDTGAKDHDGNNIYIGDTVTLLTSSKAVHFKLRRLFQKGDKVLVHGFLKGNVYFYSIGHKPRHQSYRLPKNLLKE